VPPPDVEPIGIHTARTAKQLNRALDDALVAAGGSLALWLVLVSLKGPRFGTQRELAAAIGVESPTLTHHLNKMEAAGLVTRERDPANRRQHVVELTAEGDAAFFRLLKTVVAFDRRLRAGFSDDELAQLRDFLDRLRANSEG
jgi:MarR family transcriptional regulator, transcriptional regulator for hemolysin